MTLQASGTINFNDINYELALANNSAQSINQANYRTLAGVPAAASQISLSSFYNKGYFGTSQAFGSWGTVTAAGVNAPGGGPSCDPGTVRPNTGGSQAVNVCLGLRTYWSNSGGASQTYNSPTDQVFVSPTTNWNIQDMATMGIVYTDVRSTSAARTVAVTVDIDNTSGWGYYTITKGTVALSLWGSGTWTQSIAINDPSGGRGRNRTGSYSIPAPATTALVVAAHTDDNGTSNIRRAYT